MNAYANVSLIENKLDELLSENHLVHTFRTSSYPVVLTISQDASPEAQVAHRPLRQRSRRTCRKWCPHRPHHPQVLRAG